MTVLRLLVTRRILKQIIIIGTLSSMEIPLIHTGVAQVKLFQYIHHVKMNLFQQHQVRMSGQNLLRMIFCEELSQSHLFSTGKFLFWTKRKVYLTSKKYFNQRLLNYTQKQSSDSDYIFFAQLVIQKLNRNSQINIAMRKATSNQFTTGMLSSNFNEKVKEFIASDEAFTFMNSMKGTPACWKTSLFDVLVLLGVPSFLWHFHMQI